MIEPGPFLRRSLVALVPKDIKRTSEDNRSESANKSVNLYRFGVTSCAIKHFLGVSTYQAEQNALQDGTPTVSEILKLVRFEPSGLDAYLAYPLEGEDGEGDDHDEEDEEGQAGHEEVRRLDAGTEGDSFDSPKDDRRTHRVNSVIDIRSLYQLVVRS